LILINFSSLVLIAYVAVAAPTKMWLHRPLKSWTAWWLHCQISQHWCVIILFLDIMLCLVLLIYGGRVYLSRL